MNRLLQTLACVLPIATSVGLIACALDASAAPEVSNVTLKLDSEQVTPETDPEPVKWALFVSGNVGFCTTSFGGYPFVIETPTIETGDNQGSGTFVGRVVFSGTVPTPRTIPAKCAPGGFARDEKILVSPERGVANTFIYIAKLPKKLSGLKFGAPSTPVVFDQKGCRFTPHCSIVQVGQPLRIRNSDTVIHNSHLYPMKQIGASPTIQPGDQTGIDFMYVTAEPRPVPVKCDFHSWMSAWHLVLDHPFAALSDVDGRFEIKDLPAGQYRFVVWHEAAGYLIRRLDVTIRPNSATEIEIDFSADKINN